MLTDTKFAEMYAPNKGPGHTFLRIGDKSYATATIFTLAVSFLYPP